MTLELDLRHRFDGLALDVQFRAPKGVTALFGPSGAGKSTVVSVIAGLLRPDEGRVLLDGEALFDSARSVHLPPHRRRMGIVFQDGRLFPHLTVMQNLLYGQKMRGRRKDPKRLAQVVELLGLRGLTSRRPATLSGGERQRVAMGRALMADPKMLLLDEPMAALDSARKAEIMPYLKRLCDEADVPILFVSHDRTEIEELATHVVALDAGRVVGSGPAAEMLATPDGLPGQTGRWASVLEGRVTGREGEGLLGVELEGLFLRVPGPDLPAGRPVRMLVDARDVLIFGDRPEQVSALNHASAVVTDVRRVAGGDALVTVTMAEQPMVALVREEAVQNMKLLPGRACHVVMTGIKLVGRG